MGGVISEEGVLTLKTMIGNLTRLRYLTPEEKEEVHELIVDLARVIIRLQD